MELSQGGKPLTLDLNLKGNCPSPLPKCHRREERRGNQWLQDWNPQRKFPRGKGRNQTSFCTRSYRGYRKKTYSGGDSSSADLKTTSPPTNWKRFSRREPFPVLSSVEMLRNSNRGQSKRSYEQHRPPEITNPTNYVWKHSWRRKGIDWLELVPVKGKSQWIIPKSLWVFTSRNITRKPGCDS